MLKKSVHTIFYLFAGIFFLGIGFASIFASEQLMKYILLILSIGIFINAILRFFLTIKKESANFNLFFRTLLDLFFSSLLIHKMEFISNSIVILFGLYLLLQALFEIVNFYIYEKNRVSGKLRVFLHSCILLFFALLLITQPNQNLKFVGLVTGIYFVFYGLLNLNDFLCEIIPQKYSNKIKSKIRIPLPIFLTFLIPQKLINLINDTLEVKKDKSILYSEKEKENADLYVLIHLAKSGSAAFGHVEIAFEDKIYSYGNYDRHSRKLFDSIGDGVLAVADKDAYIEYNVLIQNRYLMEFGLKLTEKQKEKVRKRIQKLLTTNTIPYHSDLELYEKEVLKNYEGPDISSDLYKLANAKYYKITKGKMKTFFVLKTNCVVVAESILRSLGTFVPENGIIAPGTYYDYLNNEFLKRNSAVISRKIYTKETLSK